MISYEHALELLKKYIKDKITIKHSVGVSEFSFNLSKEIAHRHSELNINPNKVRIAGLLHDIGKEIEGAHEINSIKILEKEGLAEIAKIVLHGYLYEKSILKNKPDKNLLPKSIENKIVAYSDFRFRDKILTLKERIAEIKVRKKDLKFDMEALSLSEKRYYDMENEILGLTRHKI